GFRGRRCSSSTTTRRETAPTSIRPGGTRRTISATTCWRHTTGRTTPSGVGALEVPHRGDEDGIGEAPLQLLRADLLDPGLDPPDVTQWIAYASHAIAEEQVRDLGPRG